MKRNRRNKGFSLIELLIVIAIIAIMVAIAVPQLIKASQAARETARPDEMRELGKAQLLYMETSGTNVYGSLATLSTDGFIDLGIDGTAWTKDGYGYAGNPTDVDVATWTVADDNRGEVTLGDSSLSWEFICVPQNESCGGYSYFIDETQVLRQEAFTGTGSAVPSDSSGVFD